MRVVYKKEGQRRVETDSREFSGSATTSGECKEPQKVRGSIPEVSCVKQTSAVGCRLAK